MKLFDRICVIVGLYIFVSGSLSAAADELYQFAMYHSGTISKEDCVLVSRYSTLGGEATKFHGQLTEKGCEVVILREIYEERFQFCFLSGFNLYRINDPEMIECVIQKRDIDYSFLATAGKSINSDGQVMCYFTCIGGGKK